MTDRDGYGFEPHDRSVDRLLSDFRTLSPAGIERAAWGWDRHVGSHGQAAFKEAEKAAVEVIEKSRRGSDWDTVRRAIYNLTEGDHRAIAWEVEHGETGHRSEHAAYGAALALLAGDQISKGTQHVLLRPLAEALPWLLPDTPPSPAG